MPNGKKQLDHDLRQTLPRESTGHRFFEHDVFLSHNSEDGSHLICESLKRLGVSAWHDGYADMTQRAVQSLIWGALTQSRYICVCVGDHFRDSDWVRLEYGAGLRIEQRFGIPRVVVALTGSRAEAPPQLANHPVFNVHSEGLTPLAAFLQEENATRSQHEVVKNRGKRLRGIIDNHTNIKLSPTEEALLARGRVAILLASPPELGPHNALGYLLSGLRHDCTGRIDHPPIHAGDHEMAAALMDIFEAISRHAGHVQTLDAMSAFWWSGYTSHGILGMLGCLITHPQHKDRAVQSFERICSILATTTSESSWRKNEVYNWRRFARGLARGDDYMQALHRTNKVYYSKRSRPWWKIW